MGKTAFKTFATFTVLLLVLATAFTLIFGLCDTHIFAPLDIASATSAEATTSADYYASVENLSTNGASFRSSLASLITSTHKKLTTYDDLRDIYSESDKDPDKSGNILWFYTGTSVKYTGFGSNISSTNREHVWAKHGGDAFSPKSGPGSDAHHLRPANANLNSTRGDLSFDIVSKTAGSIAKQNGSTTYENLCYYGGGFFYPGVGYRGATARILMYVETRWGDENKLQFTTGTGSDKTIGNIATLMKWHLEEPVTAAEIARNNYVYSIQGNRNPFIDHPEYAEKIYCHDGKSYNTALQAVVAGTNNEPISGLAFNEKAISIALGETKSLSPVYTPSNAKRDVAWESSDTTVATVDSYGKITAKANGTTTITVSSKENPSIKATLTLTVKSVSSISVSGKPTKTTYNSGETFDTTGISVTAHFSDGSTSAIDNSSCQWLDAVTGQNTLSAGTTSVICKFTSNGQTFEDVVNGITVKKITGGGKTIITLDSITTGSSYSWCPWTANGISGQIYMYPQTNKNAIQVNKKSGTTCYLYNTTPIPSTLISITITLVDGKGKNFEVYTSNTPYTSGTSLPTTGTKIGTIAADTNGVTLSLNTTDKYFTINYLGTGVCLIKSIEILYGEQEAECVHDWSAWTVTKQPTYTQKGTEERVCSKCNEKETRDVPMLVCDHQWSNWTVTKPATTTEKGSEERVCSKCNEKETRDIPIITCDHQWSAWTTTKEPTYTETGVEERICSQCNEKETRTLPKLVCSAHNYGEWTTTKEPTIFETGVKEHTCSICGHKETQDLPKLENPLGDVTAEDFVNAVNAIDNATTIEEKQVAIKHAQDVFNALPQEEKLKDETQNAFGWLSDKQQALAKQLQAPTSLSGGEIAGICVGCVVGVALIGVILYFVIFRRKASRS